MEPDSHFKLAEEYFRYLAARFPVMCASDEFHFFPRAETALLHLERLDSLSPESIAETVSALKDFQTRFMTLSGNVTEPEAAIDLDLLRANAAGILLDFEENRTWQHNPLVYLKIAFIGLDHALNKPASNTAERQDRSLSRMSAIPRLLGEGVGNIRGIPKTYQQAACDMVGDCRRYLLDEVIHELKRNGHQAQSILEPVLESLARFNMFLESTATIPDKRFEAASIETTLRAHYSYPRPLKEIFEIAVGEWEKNLSELERLGRKIDNKQTWLDLYHAYTPAGIDTSNTITLYGSEIQNICRFFENKGLSNRNYFETMALRETPRYLLSVRSGASFGASLTATEQEKSYFYITTGGLGEAFDEQRKRRFHREFRFLIAHETIPGHHFLDSIRRGLGNPVRRQIESALFYEGWASFSESLLFEYGYLEHPLDRLVNCKRWLWRAARCQIDVGLPQGYLTEGQAVELLLTAGFSKVEAVAQIDRFSLNPGYQLCYSLGSYEFKQIKKQYGHRFGRTDFYKHLLDGGELPFQSIHQRYEAILERTKNS